MDLLFNRRAVPFVQQLSATECGAACLAMCLQYYGKRVDFEELRAATVGGRDATNAAVLMDAARSYGLHTRAVTIQMPDLAQLPAATILHWDFRHFIVFERVTKTGVSVVDPSAGRLHIPFDTFSKHFTGVALLVEPGGSFTGTTGERDAVGRFAGVMRPHSVTLTGTVLISVLFQGLVLGMPLISGILIDDAAGLSRGELLRTLVVVLLALVCLQAITGFTRSQLTLYLRTRVEATLMTSFLAKLLALPFDFVQRRGGGDLLLRLNSNSYVRETLTGALLSTLLDGLFTVMSLALLLWLNAWMAVLVVGLAVAHIGVFVIVRRQQALLLADNLETQALSQGLLIETVSGIEVLKSMGLESVALSRWSDLYSRDLNNAIGRGQLDSITDSAGVLIRGISSVAILVVAIQQVMTANLTFGGFVALTAIANGFLAAAVSLLGVTSRTQLLSAYLERLDDVYLAEPEDSPAARPPGRLTGKIELQGLSFSYGPASPLAVRDLSLAIDSGEFVAIVGRSGCGKSTLARLLVGLYKPTTGRVLYDDQDLRTLLNGQLRRQIGFVTQQAHLFNGTIATNIALSAPDAPMEDIVRAARMADIHEQIVAMNMGYNTPVTNRGASLSGGEQQRIALARAFMATRRIIVLDEATSNLDAGTEENIRRALERLACTRIVIAHRLSSIINADRIVMMDRGAIVETGRHPQLLQRRGAYASLVDSQVRQ